MFSELRNKALTLLDRSNKTPISIVRKCYRKMTELLQRASRRHEESTVAVRKTGSDNVPGHFCRKARKVARRKKRRLFTRKKRHARKVDGKPKSSANKKARTLPRGFDYRLYTSFQNDWSYRKNGYRFCKADYRQFSYLRRYINRKKFVQHKLLLKRYSFQYATPDPKRRRRDVKRKEHVRDGSPAHDHKNCMRNGTTSRDNLIGGKDGDRAVPRELPVPDDVSTMGFYDVSAERSSTMVSSSNVQDGQVLNSTHIYCEKHTIEGIFEPAPAGTLREKDSLREIVFSAGRCWPVSRAYRYKAILTTERRVVPFGAGDKNRMSFLKFSRMRRSLHIRTGLENGVPVQFAQNVMASPYSKSACADETAPCSDNQNGQFSQTLSFFKTIFNNFILGHH